MALSSQRGLCLICHYAVQRDALDTVHGLLSGGCGDLIAEREFPSDKVYRRDDRGLVGVEFEISKDHAGNFRFHLKAPNGEIIAASQGYETKANAEKGIEAIKTHAPSAKVEDH